MQSVYSTTPNWLGFYQFVKLNFQILIHFQFVKLNFQILIHFQFVKLNFQILIHFQSLILSICNIFFCEYIICYRK